MSATPPLPDSGAPDPTARPHSHRDPEPRRKEGERGPGVEHGKSGRRQPGHWVRFGLIAAVFVLAAFVAWHFGYYHLNSRAALASTIGSLRGVKWIIPIFIAGYAVVAAFALPVLPLNLAAGALFGFWFGVLYVWIGAMIGASAGYWLARIGAKDAARKMLGTHTGVLDKLKDKRAFLAVFRLQVTPIMPFGLVNVASGIAGVPFGVFLLATALGNLPGDIAYVFAAEKIWAGFAGSGNRALTLGAIGLGAMLALSFVPAVYKKLMHKKS